MDNSYPLVSIIVNCHNGEKYLKNCIKTILFQTYKNWEIIFWDNNSTDKSAKIFKSFINKRFHYYYTKRTMTLYEARNQAILKARGKYVCFLDTDDKWTQNKLKLQVNYLEKNKNYSMVYSNYSTLEEKNKILKKKFNYFLPSGKITQNLLNNYFIGILTVLVRRKIFKNLKFNSIYNIIGDFDFFIRLSLKSEIGAIQKVLAVYRLHGNNLSLKRADIHKKELNFWIKKTSNNSLYAKHSLISLKYYLFKLSIKFFIRKYFEFKLGA